MSDELDQRPPFKPARIRILGALKKERQLRRAAEREARDLRREVQALKQKHGERLD